MSSGELLNYYERMYELEHDVKERISTRVQVAFTLIIAVATVGSYMLRMLDLEAFPELTGVIVLLMLVFFVLLAISAYFSVRAFWGNEFKQMPSAQVVGDYYVDLIEFNDNLAAYKVDVDPDYSIKSIDIDAEMSSFFSDYYRECADHNAQVNQVRSRQAHQSIKFLLLSMAPFAFAGLVFISFDMDASSPRKNALISDRYVAEQLGLINKTLGELVKERR